MAESRAQTCGTKIRIMPTITPDPILKIATGFMAAKHLFAASEIGLFEALASGPASLEELAGKTAVPARTVGIVAAAMVSLGLIEDEGGRYRNGEVAARHSLPASPATICDPSCVSSIASAIRFGKGSPTLYAPVRVRRSLVNSIASSSRYFQPVLRRLQLQWRHRWRPPTISVAINGCST